MKFGHISAGDFIIFFLILFCGIFLSRNIFKKSGDLVKIQSETKSYQYSAKINNKYKIPGPLGITVVEIAEGKARIIESPCPNKTCINQGWGKTIVCLPNQVIVTLENEEELDAIAE